LLLIFDARRPSSLVRTGPGATTPAGCTGGEIVADGNLVEVGGPTGARGGELVVGVVVWRRTDPGHTRLSDDGFGPGSYGRRSAPRGVPRDEPSLEADLVRDPGLLLTGPAWAVAVGVGVGTFERTTTGSA
jgi:hypothetical protein